MGALGGFGGLLGADPRDLERLLGGAGQQAPLHGGGQSKKARQRPAPAERAARPTPSKRRKKGKR